ncbi:MAG: signal peptidase II [Candidatus Pacearchaeota archaeon]|nr:MAG: signal peptidase II [Candidatus Pacearchaeota archaeon]
MPKKKVMEKGGGEKKLFLFLITVFFIFALDRYTKLLSQFVSGCFIFCIKQSVNYGAAFSLLSGFEWTRILLIIVALLVLFFTAFFYFQDKNFNYFHIGLILLFAGTLSNLFDRIYFGYVTDFLTLSFIPIPAFNLADVSNVIGVVILIWTLIKK